MLKRIYSLTPKGGRTLLQAIGFTALHNISVILPTVVLLLLTLRMVDLHMGRDVAQPQLGTFWTACFVLMVGIYVIYRQTYRKIYIGAYKECASTRLRLADKIRRLPLSCFGKRDLGDLTSAMMDDTATVEHIFTTCVAELFGGLISSLCVVLTLFILDWRMSIALFCCLPLSFLALVLSHRVGSSFNWNNRNAKLGFSEGLQEYLDNMKVLRASPNREAYRLNLEGGIRRIVRASIIYELVMGVFLSAAYNLLRVGVGLVVVAGAWLLLRGELDLAVYLLFLFVSVRVYDPLTTVLFKAGEFFYSLVSASRIREIYDSPVQGGDPDVVLERYDIEFENVSFGYEEELVLRDVSFTAEQGRITALVGPSGGGKSTLTRLASRFWDVSQGRILVGGVDVRAIDPETLLRSYAIVFQDVVLFNDTVHNNIAIGKTGATREEIVAAARLARCHEFIERLENGYDTVIGENGKTLSGGERQRISIARAFLKDAPIILLDEATASLDPSNETLIQQALSELIRDKTVLIIAHRLRSVETCDKIVVLEKGRVVEEGSHDDLMAACGLYSHLHDLQRKSGAWGLGSRTAVPKPPDANLRTNEMHRGRDGV
jgi:ATP-binding cassette subfamily B protein